MTRGLDDAHEHAKAAKRRTILFFFFFFFFFFVHVHVHVHVHVRGARPRLWRRGGRYWWVFCRVRLAE